MKRSTAIRNVVEMCEVATDHLRFRESSLGWPLEELWITGDLIEGAESLDWIASVLTLDVPADELPWMATHGAGYAVEGPLQLGKRPVSWVLRPMVWPPWNARYRSVLRVWSASEGTHEDLIEDLRHGRPVPVVEPSDEVHVEQMLEERDASMRHLRRVVDEQEDYAWARQRDRARREERLWRAAAAVIEIEDALSAER